MTDEYYYNTLRKEGDYVIFDYEQIKFNLQYHILPYYSKTSLKRSGVDRLIDKEMDGFINNLTGTVQASSIPSAGCELLLRFKGGGEYLFNEDTYLNKCHLVHNEQDAKAVLYVLVKRAIEELQTSLWRRIFPKN